MSDSERRTPAVAAMLERDREVAEDDQRDLLARERRLAAAYALAGRAVGAEAHLIAAAEHLEARRVQNGDAVAASYRLAADRIAEARAIVAADRAQDGRIATTAPAAARTPVPREIRHATEPSAAAAAWAAEAAAWATERGR